jgi:hypothetical protein
MPSGPGEHYDFFLSRRGSELPQEERLVVICEELLVSVEEL